jgi:quercetin dioxygenase-like cupin family protein
MGAVATEIVLKNLSDEIEQAQLDPKVNIKVASLAGDPSMSMYATVLKPGSKVTAHVHKYGVELYYILNGNGEIYSGSLHENTDVVSWGPATKVKAGDAFSINPGVVHQLKNTSISEDLTLIFVCPHSHLKEDRVISKDY